jgi:hypothetical protein
MSAPYPVREPFFAMKVIRLLAKSGEIQRIGPDASLLVTIIASTEDAKRYRGPVNFFNGQLQSLLGFAKWERLDRARRSAVEAGWLHYIAPEPGARDKPGYYWTLVPSSVADLPDTSCDESPDPLASFYHRGYADAKAGNPARPYPSQGDSPQEAYPSQGYGEGEGEGYGQGYGEGEPPILSLSLTSPDSGNPDGKNSPMGKKRKAEPAYSPEDLECANQFWERIKALQPGRKTPSIPAWAESIRLMRERDKRTHEDILDLLDRVQGDPFWRVNILSPDKLRAKFDDLQLKIKPLARAIWPANEGRAPRELTRPVKRQSQQQEAHS